MRELLKSGGFAAELATAFDASPNPYVLVTPDLRIAGMNQAYLDITHTRRDAIMGQPLFGAFTAGPSDTAPENVRQVRDSLERARDTRQRDHLALVRFAIEVETPDGPVFEERYWSATHTPIIDANGEVIFVLQHTTDITELEHLRRNAARETSDVSELDAILSGAIIQRADQVQADNRRLEGERNRLVDLFMQTPGFAAVLSGPDHVFQMANQSYLRLIGRSDIIGKTIRDAMPDIAGQGFYELLDSVLETGEPYEGRSQRLELQRTADGPMETTYLNFIYQPIRNDAGQVAGIFVQGNNVTDAVMAAERQKLMIDELNHRVKNTLATVQSIAMQTARSHDDPQTFARSFQARLMSLSHTHNLLTNSHWEGADLHEVLDHETAAHGGGRISLNGPVVGLSPAVALSLGMIFHELATNAAKYGALSSGDGRVFVDWSVSDQRDRKLHISWRETGGPPIETPPSRRGFGSRLIERNVRHDLAGTITLDYERDGLTAEIIVSLDREAERASS
ncbi:histidine kinase [Brevundimonas sp. Leaf363]|uniref:sensor histidine kinase n=1 Tax=Brevundimonas sp. Leaf363 TaxID=1736353 RepID=UPI0006F25FB3|nr:HWE histidine kinase domain-containing protein [Brevundimonas sp. Leaf363]KQS54295.1 histidine kinase [Brevundimonas sp. Leaf363]